ncbi:hypothetical protein AAG906_018357 [Vitis piasezkii]
MSLSQTLRKLTEARLLTTLTPRPPPQPVPPQFRMDLHWCGPLGSAKCNHKPITGSHYTCDSLSDQ